jgi:hypothetical protein
MSNKNHKMTPEPEISRKSRGAILKQKVKKILRWMLALFIIGLLIFIYVRYYYTYSDGYRAGELQKFSRKGTIFKTYEGELILSGLVKTETAVIASEKFYFSVTLDSLAASLDTLQGRSVIVHYREKNAPLIWRGDSPYIVDEVKLR